MSVCTEWVVTDIVVVDDTEVRPVVIFSTLHTYFKNLPLLYKCDFTT